MQKQVLMFACVVLTGGVASAQYPFQNISLPWAERVEDLVSRLTLEEIQGQLAPEGGQERGAPAPPIPRLGILPHQWSTECLRGDADAGRATSFPQAIGLAATWSPSLLYRVAEATSIEVRAKYNNYTRHNNYGDHTGVSCFSPVINIMRDPRWGRNQETYGEDPVLSGILVQSFVQGLQGNDPRFIRANAGCKHFDVHGGPENIPESRFSFDAKVSEQDWRMTFLPAFRMCVKAGTYNIMCSYNRINGVPACANKELLTDILRKEWGFQGYVISDAGAVENIISQHHYLNSSVDTVAACINAGCNVELMGGRPTVYLSMMAAIKAGKLSEATVREAVKPLFYTRMRLGEFDPPATNPFSGLDVSVIQSLEHRVLSTEAAMKSFVLLKNDGALPPLVVPESFAVVGPMADNAEQLFGDYAPDLDPKNTVTPWQGLRQMGEDARLGQGCTDTTCSTYKADEVRRAVKGVGTVYVCLGTGQAVESEGNDRPDLELPGHQLQLLQDAVTFSNGAKVVLLVFSAGPVNLTWADQNPQVKAILQCFFPAQATGQALLNVLTRSGPGSNPAGRLPYTWYKYASQVPPMTSYSMAGRTYRYMGGEPLYPFGYGLSYSSFRYLSVQLPSQVAAGQALQGNVTLVNQGPFPGDEVYQVYVGWDHPTSAPAPRLQLAALDRVSLPVLSPQTFSFAVAPETMAVWVEGKGWVVEQGRMVLYVGGQQPNQKRQVPSNVLTQHFSVVGSRFLGRF